MELRAEVAEQQAHGQQLQDYGQPRTTRFNSNNSRESVKRHEANIITPELNKLESSLIRQLDSINRRNGNVQASIRGLDWHYQNHLAGDQHNRAARRRRALFPRPAEGDDVAWRVFLAATNQTTTEERLVVQRLEDQRAKFAQWVEELQVEWDTVNSESPLNQYQQEIAALQPQLYSTDGYLQARTASQIRALNIRIEIFRSRLNLVAARTRYYQTRVDNYD